MSQVLPQISPYIMILLCQGGAAIAKDNMFFASDLEMQERA